MPKIIVSERGRREEWVHECKEDVLTIGRHDDNVLPLPSRGVSRMHAQIMKDGDDFFLCDMGSGNGTVLNGVKLTPHERYLLRNKDAIIIDTYELRFFAAHDLVDKSYDEEVTENDILEVKLLKKVLKAFDKETVPSFEVLNGSAEGTKFHLTDDLPEFIIGRDPDADVPIDEHVISRAHAKIIKRWGGIAIRDLESKNGTFVNNRKIVEEYLHDGDRIALGTIVLMFRNPQELNLSQLMETVPPKNKPAQTLPEDIPGAEAAAEEAPTEEPAPPAAEEEAPREEAPPAMAYPTHAPAPKSRLTPVEIGMIGLGALVFVFALITLVNLMFA
jgi:pSer/pThr/pTyr-binding forkhead associated (FHA) protein